MDRLIKVKGALTRLRRLNSGVPIFKVLSEASDHRYHARGTAGFPWNPREVLDRNLLLVGDAAGYAEPFSGEGIGQALRSGQMAARALLTGSDVGTAYSALMNRTHHRSVAQLGS